MKIVVLMGSPNKSGSSALLAENFIRGAQEQGHTIKKIDAAHLSLRFITMECRRSSRR